jgi:hypothetical protein
MMRSAGEGWTGRMPVGRTRSWLGRALAGCVLALAIPARGYQPIRAQITIRFNKIPTVGLR